MSEGALMISNSSDIRLLRHKGLNWYAILIGKDEGWQLMRITLDSRGWQALGAHPTFAVALRKARQNGRDSVVAALLAELAVSMREKRPPSLLRAWTLADTPDDDRGCVSGSPPYIAPEVWEQAMTESDEMRDARAALRRANRILAEHKARERARLMDAETLLLERI